MNTWEILHYIKDLLNIPTNALCNMLNLKPATYFRYLSGKYEASFKEVSNWMEEIGLNLINNQITNKENNIYQFISKLNQSETPTKYEDVLSGLKQLNKQTVFIDSKFIKNENWMAFYLASREYIENKYGKTSLKHIDNVKLTKDWSPSNGTNITNNLNPIFKQYGISIDSKDLNN